MPKSPPLLAKSYIGDELKDAQHLPARRHPFDFDSERHLRWRRYPCRPGTPECCYTSTRSPEGFFLSFVFEPYGGALSVPSIRRHRQRQDAATRALTLAEHYLPPDGRPVTERLVELQANVRGVRGL
jgi:hypothetical protein